MGLFLRIGNERRRLLEVVASVSFSGVCHDDRDQTLPLRHRALATLDRTDLGNTCFGSTYIPSVTFTTARYGSLSDGIGSRYNSGNSKPSIAPCAMASGVTISRRPRLKGSFEAQLFANGRDKWQIW